MQTYSHSHKGVAYTIVVKEDWRSTDIIEHTDFNRIESNTAIVRAYLISLQYQIATMAHVSNRTQSYIDYLAGINRIEANLETIRTSFATPPGYLPGKVWTLRKGFDFTDANRLERDLRILFEAAYQVYQSFKYCGTFSAGEEGLL